MTTSWNENKTMLKHIIVEIIELTEQLEAIAELSNS